MKPDFGWDERTRREQPGRNVKPSNGRGSVDPGNGLVVRHDRVID